MENLSGIPDVDKLILLNLDDESLSKAALVSTYVNSLMDEFFWASKFYNKYQITLSKYGVSHSYFYKKFSNAPVALVINIAIDNTFTEFLELLITDKNKEGLLIYASEVGNLDIVKLLIERGANIHDYALSHAARNGHLEVVRLLLDYIEDSDSMALNDAVRMGHIEVVKLLLSKQADIYYLADGLTQAVTYGHLDIVKLLLDRGANVHINDRDLLVLAAIKGNLTVFKLLINQGLDIHIGNDGPLRYAAFYGNIEIVELLLDLGANVNAGDDGRLIWATMESDLTLIRHLIKTNVDLTDLLLDLMVDESMYNALILATKGKHLNIINLLLDRGAISNIYINYLIIKMKLVNGES